ncbi:MAG: hypothetical protein H7326_07975 [Bdellovibrionaceae bacterium]|nr:hypothetical protein [Pseudobdellovibrionaceae bacterium]
MSGNFTKVYFDTENLPVLNKREKNIRRSRIEFLALCLSYFCPTDLRAGLITFA